MCQSYTTEKAFLIVFFVLSLALFKDIIFKVIADKLNRNIKE